MLRPWQDFKSVELRRKLSFSYDENLELASIDAPFDKDWARVPDLSTVPNTFNTLSSHVHTCFSTDDNEKAYEDFNDVRMQAFDESQQYALFVAHDFVKAYNICSAHISPDTLLYSPLNDDLHASFAHEDVDELKVNRKRSGLLIDIQDRDTPSGPVPNDLVGDKLLGTRQKWANDVIENYVYKHTDSSFNTLYDRARFQLALLSFYEPTDVVKDHPFNRDVVEMATTSESENAIAYNDLLRSYACIHPSIRHLVAQERAHYCGYDAEQPVTRFYQFEDIDRSPDDVSHMLSATRRLEDCEDFLPADNASAMKSGYDQARDLFNNPLVKQWFNPYYYHWVVSSAVDPCIKAMNDAATQLDPEYKDSPFYDSHSEFFNEKPRGIGSFRDRVAELSEQVTEHVKLYDLVTHGATSLEDSNAVKLAKGLHGVKKTIEDINEDHQLRGLPPAHLSSTRDGFNLKYPFGNDSIVHATKMLDLLYAKSSYDLHDPEVMKSYDDLLNKSTQYFKAAALGIDADVYKTFKESASKVNNVKPPTVSDVGVRTVSTNPSLSKSFEL